METNIKYPAIVAESQFPDLWVEKNRERLLHAENIIEPIICIKIRDDGKSVIISGFTALVKNVIDYIYVTEVDTRTQALNMFHNNLHPFYNKEDRAALSQELNLLTAEEQKVFIFSEALDKTNLIPNIMKHNDGKKNSHRIKPRSLYQIYKLNRLEKYLPKDIEKGLKILANYSLVTLHIFDDTLDEQNKAYKIAHLRILWKLFPYVIEKLKDDRTRYSEKAIKELFSNWEESLKDPKNKQLLRKALQSEGASHTYAKEIADNYLYNKNAFSVF